MPRFLVILGLFACAALAVPTSAEASIYLRLVGGGQGPIAGDVTDPPPVADTIAIGSFQLGSFTPIDPVTGLPIGNPIISSLTMSKSTDGSTLALLRALSRIEPMSTCELEAWRPGPVGSLEPYLRLTLTNARVEAFSMSSAQVGRASESLSFVFDALEWRDLDTGEVYNYGSGTSSVDLPDPLERYAVATSPNPTSGETQFQFRLPESGPVSIDVFDFRGRHVATVFDGEATAAEGIVSWNGRDTAGRPVASGVYLVKMRTGEWLTTHKMSVLR